MLMYCLQIHTGPSLIGDMTSVPFISLAEFLVLPDDYDGREFNHHKTGPFWLKWYEVAKASYEKYGPDGPPIGTKVITLRAGFGGGGLDIRTFTGIYTDDPRYFLLEHRYRRSGYDETTRSLSARNTWWRDFCVKEDYPNGKPLPIL